MKRFSLSNLTLLLSAKVSPKEIERIVEQLVLPSDDNLKFVSSESVTVAAVQLLIRRYASLAEYVADMNSYVADAVNRRAQLVCFPAFAGLMPMSFLPQYDAAVAQLQPEAPQGLPDADTFHEMLSYYSDYMFDAFFHTMSALAARYRIYILAGSSLYFEEDQLCHRALLFNEEGDLAGFQDKISLTPFEQDLGLTPASEVKVFDTPVGNLAILTGSDADYYEISRIAGSLGAQLLLSPSAWMGEFTPVDAALGLNMRVQENHLYGLRSALVGDTGLGSTLEGGCYLFAPNEIIARQKNGVLARGNGSFAPDVLCTSINLDKLEEIRNPYTQDKNEEVIRKYLGKLY